MFLKQIQQLILLTLLTFFLLFIDPGQAQIETLWRGHTGQFLDPDCWSEGVPDFGMGGMGNPHAIFPGEDEYQVFLDTQYNSGSDFFFLEGTISHLVGGGRLLGTALEMHDEALLTIGANTTVSMSRSDLFDNSRIVVNPGGIFDFMPNGFGLTDDASLLVNEGEFAAIFNTFISGSSRAEITDHSIGTTLNTVIGRSNPAIAGSLNSEAFMRVSEGSTWNSQTIEIGGNFNSASNPGSTESTLTIESGSSVTTDDCVVGAISNSNNATIQVLAATTFGEINVNNNAALNVENMLAIGEKGNGTLNIFNNSQVCTADLFIADGEHSTGTVIVSDQSNLNATNVFVGIEGVGTFNLTNSTLTATNFLIGSGSGTGQVIVDSSTLNSQILVGGSSGQGTLTVQPNGSVNLSVGSLVGSNGTLAMEGGELRHIGSNGSLTINGALLTSGGSIFIEDETLLTPTSSTEAAATITTFEILEHDGDEFCIPPSGRVIVTEIFRGTSSISGSGFFEFQGFVALGNTAQPVASVTIPNVVFRNDSELVVSLNGPQAGIDHDRLVVSSSLTIEENACLNLSIDPGTEFVPGQQLEILRLNNSSEVIVGTFRNTPEGSTIEHTSGVDFSISYVGGDGNDVVLTVLEDVEVILGDVNLDGVANILDVSEFVDRVTSSTFQAEADCNEDAQVDLLDVASFVAILAG